MANDYSALGSFLESQPEETRELTLTFERIEALVGGTLPPSAVRHAAWWGNENSPTSTHSHARAGWLDVGWRVRANRAARTATFFR